MNKTQSKNHNIGFYRINKASFTITKALYIKIDIVVYHILINPLLNHKQIISSNIDNLL